MTGADALVRTDRRAPAVEHVVFFPALDGTPAFRRLANLEEAVRLVEHLRNVEGVTSASVHALQEVPLSFRAYYRVETPAALDRAAVDLPVVDAPAAPGAPVPVAPVAVEALAPFDVVPAVVPVPALALVGEPEPLSQPEPEPEPQLAMAAGSSHATPASLGFFA